MEQEPSSKLFYWNAEVKAANQHDIWAFFLSQLMKITFLMQVIFTSLPMVRWSKPGSLAESPLVWRHWRDFEDNTAFRSSLFKPSRLEAIWPARLHRWLFNLCALNIGSPASPPTYTPTASQRPTWDQRRDISLTGSLHHSYHQNVIQLVALYGGAQYDCQNQKHHTQKVSKMNQQANRGANGWDWRNRLLNVTQEDNCGAQYWSEGCSTWILKERGCLGACLAKTTNLRE